MFYESDLRRWLALNYPSLKLHMNPAGRQGIWQEDTHWVLYEPETPGVEPFCYLKTGHSLVFEIDRTVRLFGGWIKDEIYRRDPRLWKNPANAYHEAYRLSHKADADLEARRAHARESGRKTWDAVKKNDRLMNRIARHMERGDMLKAGRELSLENLYRNAYLENPKELRSKDFWKATRGS